MFCVHVCLLYIWFVCVLYVSSVLWYCWLGLLTCKNRLQCNLYCVGGDVKHCSIQSNLTCCCRINWREITCCITGSTCQLSALDASVSLCLRCVNGQSLSLCHHESHTDTNRVVNETYDAETRPRLQPWTLILAEFNSCYCHLLNEWHHVLWVACSDISITTLCSEKITHSHFLSYLMSDVWILTKIAVNIPKERYILPFLGYIHCSFCLNPHITHEIWKKIWVGFFRTQWYNWNLLLK